MLHRLVIVLADTLKSGRRAECLTGQARVIDGDTMIVAGERVRLHGLDAPELGQTFWCRGQQLDCGAMALAALEALIAGVELRCEAVERDRHGRLVAKCFSPNGIDVGRRLVSAGWALAYRRYSLDYVDAEIAARKARRGMWRGQFVKPWVWRASAARQGLQTSLEQSSKVWRRERDSNPRGPC
jgi:endonuclease YncB( thermonuclease family)